MLTLESHHENIKNAQKEEVMKNVNETEFEDRVFYTH